jgi:histidine triad (HIT) family protein
MSEDSGIALPEAKACAFCAYLRGERPYTILSRTADTANFVTREQRGDPHLLVLPIRRVPTILESTDAETAAESGSRSRCFD